jgi:putative transposase
LARWSPYLILDARYEKVREAGVIVSQAVLVAVAVDEDGRRQILAVELANRESQSSWRDFLSGLKARGLAGIEFVVYDNHEGLKAAIREVLPEAALQRCNAHFLLLRNALDYVPRKVVTACRSCAGSAPDGRMAPLTASNVPKLGCRNTALRDYEAEF